MKNLLIMKFILILTVTFSRGALAEENAIVDDRKLEITRVGDSHLLASRGKAVWISSFGVLQRKKECKKFLFLRLSSYVRKVEMPNGKYEIILSGNKTKIKVDVFKNFKSSMPTKLMKLYTFSVRWNDTIQKFFEQNDYVTLSFSSNSIEQYLDIPGEDFDIQGFFPKYTQLRKECSDNK